MIKYIAFFTFILFLTACSKHKVKLQDNISTQSTDSATIETPEPQASTTEPTTSSATIEVDESDLWARVRNGFTLQDIEHERMDAHLRWFQKNQAYLNRVCSRATPYLHDIVEVLEENQIPLELALLPVIESSFRPMALSHSRAAGLWQIIPSTGRLLELKQNTWYDGRRDAHESTRAAVKYLLYLNKRMDGDWLHTIASYNAGPGRIKGAIRRNKQKNKPTDYWSLKLPKETMDYVPKLLALSRVVNDPQKENLSLCNIKNEPALTRVPIRGQLDLSVAAKLAGMKHSELTALNGGIKRWATPKHGPHALTLPLEHAERFTEKEKALPKNKRMLWSQHRIRMDETLGHIALKYKIPVSVLKSVNGLRSSRIRAGKTLRIPLQGQKSAASFPKRTRQTVQSQQKIRYPVRRGDSVYSIARKFRISMVDVLRWNRLSANQYLQPKQVLTLYVSN